MIYDLFLQFDRYQTLLIIADYTYGGEKGRWIWFDDKGSLQRISHPGK